LPAVGAGRKILLALRLAAMLSKGGTMPTSHKIPPKPTVNWGRLSRMASRLQILSPKQSAAGVNRERELTATANRLVDAVYADCEGNLGEMALVFSYALASVVRSWPNTEGREILAKAELLLQTTLRATYEVPIPPADRHSEARK